MNVIARMRAAGLALAVLVFAVDQWVKGQVVGPLRLEQVGQIEILSFFNLTYARNYGVSLGMFEATSSEMRWVLVGFTLLIAVFVAVWMLREKAWGEVLGLSLILGGAAGNIVDRVSYGYVIDYADLHFGTFRPFLIFNVADAAISIGVAIILARALFMREKPAASDGGEQAERSAETK